MVCTLQASLEPAGKLSCTKKNCTLDTLITELVSSESLLELEQLLHLRQQHFPLTEWLGAKWVVTVSSSSFHLLYYPTIKIQ